MSVKVMARLWEHGPADRTELLVMLALADNANDAGVCWPSIETIAAKCRMTDRGVQKAIARLVDGGWLAVERGGGRHGCNVYTIRNPEPGSPNSVHPEPRSPRTRVQKTPNPVPKTPNGGSPEPSLNHQGTVSSPYSPPPGFDDFWSVVPRKVAKGAAAKAWARAVKKAPPETIIAAMRVYARSREGEDPTYTAHPATWLNAERWDDDPPPPSQPKHQPTRSSGDARLDAAMRAAARFDAMDSGPGAYPSQPLLPAGPRRDDDRGRDFGLDFDFEAVAEGSNLRLVR